MAVQIRDVMGVMDTVEKLSAAETKTSRDELRNATRAVYRDQGLSVPDRLLEQALDIHEKKSEGAVLPWLEPDADELQSAQNLAIHEDRKERFVSASSFSLLEVILVLGIMVCAMMVIFVTYGAVTTSQRAQEDVQRLAQMTTQSKSENAHQAVTPGVLNEWLRDRANQNERFEVTTNAQNPQWSDIETVGLPVKACEAFVSDSAFRITLTGASSGAPPMSPRDCQQFSNDRMLLHRLK